MPSVSRVYVHIGPMKTGTTFIQAVLFKNRDTLQAQGVVLPRETFGLHVQSVLGLLGRRSLPGGDDQGSRRWRMLVDEVGAADADTAVISMEFLATATARHVKMLVETMAPAEVHVVYTARDLVKVIPAAWQTLLRNKQAPPWDAWLASVRAMAAQGPAGRSAPAAAARRVLGRNADPAADSWGARLWQQQDPRQVLAPYLRHIPADRVHVVTVPPPGSPPDLLWERFCAATAMTAAAYDIDVPRANVSLGGVECEVLRRVNRGVAGRIPTDLYTDLVKFFLAREVLEQRAQSFPLVLPDQERSWVAERTADAVAYFEHGGFRLYGDLADLVAPQPTGAAVRRPDDVTETEVLAVTEDTLAAVLLEMTRRQGLEPYQGPRSDEEPLPPPEDFGLTGDPPAPGARQAARAHQDKHGDPPAIAARKAAKKAARQARRAARRSGTGPGPNAAGRPGNTAGSRTAGKKAAGKKAVGKKAAGKKAAGKKAAAKAAGPPGGGRPDTGTAEPGGRRATNRAETPPP